MILVNVKLFDRHIFLILDNRWKQEFDSEPKPEGSKKDGRPRTDEEQDLSVQDFNEIRLNELIRLNTKGMDQTLSDRNTFLEKYSDSPDFIYYLSKKHFLYYRNRQ